jgi:hypothetical protein
VRIVKGKGQKARGGESMWASHSEDSSLGGANLKSVFKNAWKSINPISKISLKDISSCLVDFSTGNRNKQNLWSLPIVFMAS